MSFDIDIQKDAGDFHLDVKLKEDAPVITGLLGASGCGKSMTLKCVAGIITPDKGKIVVNGETYFDSEKGINLKPQERKTGYLFQNYALFPNMTVEENIAAGISRKDFSKEKIQAEIKRFGLSGKEKLHPSALSGGQQQRCALARIFIRDPNILMLDEPFSALDSSLRWSLQQDLLQFLKDYNRSILFVSHSRDEIYMLCENAGVMEEGRLIDYDSTKRLFAHPRTRAALSLTGCRNISPVKASGEKRALFTDWDLELELNHPIKPGILFGGIRAHYFTPCRKEDVNAIEIEVVQVINEPFASNILFKKKGVHPKQLMCWRVSHDQIKDLTEFPSYLQILPENILLVE